MTTFKQLGLDHDIMSSLTDLGFTEPTPIQAEAIPHILGSKKDLIALAQTGTGKTAAFGLPILTKVEKTNKQPQAIILCPTRELCLQISADLRNFSRNQKGVAITSVYGGERIDMQIGALRRGTNIVVGTPGRVHDLLRRKILKLQDIKWLVLDEADEMLDMGFRDDLDAILAETSGDRQTLLFSATMSKSVYAITKKYMKDAMEISIGDRNVGADSVSHEYYIVNARDRFDALMRILDSLPGVYGILFCRTKNETQEIADKLRQAHYEAEALHGDISQTMRTKVMDRFKKKQNRLLVATDVAARGIDVSDLTHIINYDLPDRDEAYTHRTGRTGRAQKRGVAISIIGVREQRRINELEKVVGKKIERKQLPSGTDVIEKQLLALLDQIQEKKNEANKKNEDFSKITEKMQKIKKDDLIAYVIADKFSSLVANYQEARDLNVSATQVYSRESSSEHLGLRISIGKKQGLDIKTLFGLINSQSNMKGVEIGRIELSDNEAVFFVEKKRVADMISCLDNRNFRGHKIKVTETGEKGQAQSRPKKRSSFGFRGKRRPFRR